MLVPLYQCLCVIPYRWIQQHDDLANTATQIASSFCLEFLVGSSRTVHRIAGPALTWMLFAATGSDSSLWATRMSFENLQTGKSNRCCQCPHPYSRIQREQGHGGGTRQNFTACPSRWCRRVAGICPQDTRFTGQEAQNPVSNSLPAGD